MSHNKTIVAVQKRISDIRDTIDNLTSDLQMVIDDFDDNEDVDTDVLGDAISNLENANEEAAAALGNLEGVSLPDETDEAA